MIVDFGFLQIIIIDIEDDVIVVDDCLSMMIEDCEISTRLLDDEKKKAPIPPLFLLFSQAFHRLNLPSFIVDDAFTLEMLVIIFDKSTKFKRTKEIERPRRI